MANNLKFSAGLRNAMLDAITTTVGGSALWRIYDGSQPAGPGTAVTTQVKLAELTCNTTFAPAASGGVLTLNSITQDSSADATGTAAWWRLLTSGATACIDGTAGTSGSDLNLNSTAITAGAIVQISSATFTAGNA
jgi:hypothetical protein